MRLLLFSDLHLDMAFAWAPAPVARRRRQALRDTLVRIIQLADEVDADVILCGGDLYEHDRFSPDTTAFVQSTLGECERRVVIAPGNHDWFGPSSLYVQADWPPNVTVFKQNRLEALELDDGLTLWGAAHRAPAGTRGFFERDFAVDRTGVHLALFHGSERSGLPFEVEGKQPHAPFDADQLEAAGIDHAFLGHYHRPRDEPRYTYPGNPDPLAFGEDDRRGVVIADVRPDGTITRERRRVAVSRVADVEVDVTGCRNHQEVKDRVREVLADHEGFIRLTVNGQLSQEVELHLSELQRQAPHLEGVVVRRGSLQVAYDLEAISAERTIRGRFVRDVLDAPNLDDDQRQGILVTGLRALEGREDLEVG